MLTRDANIEFQHQRKPRARLRVAYPQAAEQPATLEILVKSDDLPRPERLDADDIRRIDAMDNKNKDWLLLSLIEVGEAASGHADLSFGITLFVGGAQIAGNLVSGRVYIDSLAKTIESATGSNVVAEALSKAVRGIGSEIYGKVGDSVAAADGSEELPNVAQRRFIHLLDAQVLNPDINAPAGRGIPWPGKIAAVDGFVFGRLSYSPKT